MKILVTGAAGFIGSSLIHKLAGLADQITGLDNINDSYDVRLKLKRLENCGIVSNSGRFIDSSVRISSLYPNYTFIKMDLADRGQMAQLFKNYQFDTVIHLAAQDGDCSSLANPYSSLDNNLVGMMNLLECCRQNGTGHLVFASSSSVYDSTAFGQISETCNADCPDNIFAASRRAGELLALSYSRMHFLPCTALRLFNVYGPWGRPDMDYMKFAAELSQGKQLSCSNARTIDFCYIDDIIEGILRILKRVPSVGKSSSEAPWELYNLGAGQAVKTNDIILEIGRALGVAAEPLLATDDNRDSTCLFSDNRKIHENTGFKANVQLQDGIGRFVEWYKSYTGPKP